MVSPINMVQVINEYTYIHNKQPEQCIYYSDLLSEWCNRSVIRIGEVTLTTHTRSAWDPCFLFRFNRFTTDTHCFYKSPTLGNREITNLAITQWHSKPPRHHNNSLAAS